MFDWFTRVCNCTSPTAQAQAFDIAPERSQAFSMPARQISVQKISADDPSMSADIALIQSAWSNTEANTEALFVLNMFRDMAIDAQSGSDIGLIFKCSASGGTTGLINIRDSGDCLVVHAIVTAPGNRGAGRSLISKAIEVSHEAGYRGNLLVEAKDSSIGFYEHIGFIRTEPGGDVLELDPGRSPYWQQPSAAQQPGGPAPARG